MNDIQSDRQFHSDRIKADLPFVERLTANAAFKVGCLTRSCPRLIQLFESEVTAIVKVLDGEGFGVLADEGDIRRMAGLRRSSCQWTPLMVVDHLTRYNEFLFKSIGDLCSVSKFLPEYRYFEPRDVDSDRIDEFQENAWHFISTVNNLIENEAMRHAVGTVFHPLYGHVEAKGLLVIAWQHSRLHRRQIQRILTEQGMV